LNKLIVKYEATVTSNGVTVKVTDLQGKLIDLRAVCLNINNVLITKHIPKDENKNYEVSQVV